METKKLAATFAVLVIVLGVVGYAYAHWSVLLTIDGSVTTGSVDAELDWEVYFSDANFKDTDDDGTPDYEVATCTCTLTDPQTLTVDIDNVYPCLSVLIIMSVDNTGTIPIGVYEVPTPTWDTNMEAIYEGVDSSDWGWYSLDGATPWQIDPDDTLYVWGVAHFGEGTPQGTTGTGSVSVEFANWNEVTLGPGDFPATAPADTTDMYVSCSGP
jgi:hypothetical protein